MIGLGLVGIAFLKAVGDWLPVSGNAVPGGAGGIGGAELVPGPGSHLAYEVRLNNGETVFNPNALHDEATNIELDQILKQHGVQLHGSTSNNGTVPKANVSGKGKRRGKKESASTEEKPDSSTLPSSPNLAVKERWCV